MLVPPVTGSYQIHVTSNDGARLRIGDRVVYEDWTDHSTKTDTVPLALTEGRPEPIVTEYFYSGGSGVMRLAWTRPDGVRETIPASAWRQSAESAPGLAVTYFRAVELRDAWFSDVDRVLDHDFGASGPRRRTNPFAPAGALEFTLERGRWAVSWLNPVTGRSIRGVTIAHDGGTARLTMPPWEEDVVVRIRRDTPAPPGR